MTTKGSAERVLRLLMLLQQRLNWTATELAAELEITPRLVPRDVERLRSLGYPVEATSGVGGGYRLGAGTRLPPLLLDDAEATATAVSLRLASGGTVAGTTEAALRVLSKLDQVMPPRLRAHVHAVHDATETLAGAGIQIEAEVLLTLARACLDTVRVRFHYTSADGAERERRVEPLRMVTTGWRWYLMAFDLDRDDWRTFRLDRMSQVEPTTWRFRVREHPEPTVFVQQSVTAAPYGHLARVRLRASADQVRALVPAQVGRVEQDRDGWSLLTVGGDDLDWLAVHVARLGFEAEILEPSELREAAESLALRLGELAGTGGR